NIGFDFDKNKIKSLIEENAEQYNQEAVNASLVKTETGFQVTEGQSGMVVDTAASADAVYDYLAGEWDGTECDVDLVITVDEPAGTAEDLAKVKDVLGTFTTSYSTSGGSRSANVSNGCSLINGTTLYPGEEFSTYEAVAPFSQANGYYMAGSYLNGQVVDSLGGGICQVSTTLYNAVLLSELEVTERYNHSMIVTYVDPSADAAIAESSGKDFKFVNNTEYPVYIEGSTTPDKQITFTIYGVETRDSNREISYESVVLERINPDTEVIHADASRPVGYCSVQSAHIGYKAQLWKVVRENGVEVSREQVNSSSYMKAPRSATVGVATEDEGAYNAIMAAIATNSIDEVKAVAGAYQAAADAAAAQAAAEAQAAAGEQPGAEAPAAPAPEAPQPEPQPQPEEVPPAP
ncbi:MAG: VanW family protein, partial [Lachnospiraceae bacterium]|nr:VanW family protein [Lachnospiraceae bacterium]